MSSGRNFTSKYTKYKKKEPGAIVFHQLLLNQYIEFKNRIGYNTCPKNQLNEHAGDNTLDISIRKAYSLTCLK